MCIKPPALCLRHNRPQTWQAYMCVSSYLEDTHVRLSSFTTHFTTSRHNMPQTEVYTYQTASSRLHSVDVYITTSFTTTLLLALLLALVLHYSVQTELHIHQTASTRLHSVEPEAYIYQTCLKQSPLFVDTHVDDIFITSSYMHNMQLHV